MEDTGSLSVFDNRDVKVERRHREPDTYRLIVSSQHGVVYLRKWVWSRPGDISGYVSGLGGSNPRIALFEGYEIPAAELEALRKHIEAFHRVVYRKQQELAYV